jgi:hypothetical protein
MDIEWATDWNSGHVDTMWETDWTSGYMDTEWIGLSYEQRAASGKRASNCPKLPDFGTLSGKRTTNPPESAPEEEDGRNKCLFSNCSPERYSMARNKCTISTSHRFYWRAAWGDAAN